MLPAGADPSSFAQLLSVTVPLGDQRAILALVRQQDAEALCRQVEGLHGHCLPIPTWIEGAVQHGRSRLAERLSALDLQIERLTTELRELAERSGVARSLGVLQRLEWLISHAHNLSLTEEYCWITGWTTASDEAVLNRALANSGVAATVEFLEAPEHVRSPSLFDNPAWARPF